MAQSNFPRGTQIRTLQITVFMIQPSPGFIL
jgi:hypothetical protein